MATKFMASLLLATALPLPKAFAHYGEGTDVPVTGYLFLMTAIGAIYFLYLLVRVQRSNVKSRK